MSSSTTNAGWTETLAMGSLPVSLDPVISQIMQTPPLDPAATMMEHILATLARFETRMNDQDRRIAANDPPSRPEPDPPYSLPLFNPTAAVAVSIPTLPFSTGIPLSINPSAQPWRQQNIHPDHTDFVPRPPPGFRASGHMGANNLNPNGPSGFPRTHGPKPYVSRPPSTWDNLSSRLNLDAQQWRHGSSSWDHPSARQLYGANIHVPTK